MTTPIYEHIKESTPKGFTKAVLDCLKEIHGQENALTKTQIGIKTRGAYNKSIDRQIRDAVSELVEVFGEDIVTTTRTETEETEDGLVTKVVGGYYHPATIEELEANIADLSSRIEHLKDRRESLYRVAARKFKVVYPDMKSQDQLFPDKEVIMVEEPDPMADPNAKLVQDDLFGGKQYFF